MKSKINIKYKSDFGESKIPQKIIQEAREYIASSEDQEYKSKFEDIQNFFEDFYEANDFVWQLKEPILGTIVPKEIAEFLIMWENDHVSDNGGYPKLETFIFDVHGWRYTICFYGWTGDLEQDPKNISFDSIGYREKIKHKSKNATTTKL